jgi:chromosome condensin MukBEF ATPase and DNA-binding subunit MukB
MNNIDREVGHLEARMDSVETEIRALRHDVRDIRDAIVSVKGGWRLFVLTVSAATAFGALAGKYVPILLGKHL